MGGKKKGFGSMLASIFVEQIDDDDDELSDDELVESLTEDRTMKVVNTTEAVVEKKKEPKLNSDIVEAIKTVMDEANLDGYDYYEFMHSISEQQDMPSEKKKYEVVFSVIKGMGITKEHLLTTADHYINVIGQHRADFDSKVNAEEQEKVVKLQNKAEVIEGGITEKTERIEALKKEIEDLHKEKVSVLDVVSENDAQITQLRQEGSLAYKLFTNQIKDGKTKINKYIS